MTPLSAIMIDQGGERTIVTYRDPKLMQIRLGDTDTLLKNCAAILTESRCAPFATEICIAARQRRIPVVVDGDQMMSLREGLLTASSHVIFSTRAAEGDGRGRRPGAGTAPPRRGDGCVPRRHARRRRHDLARPARLRRSACRPFRCIPWTRSAPGDVFHGAFTMEIAAGASIEDAMRFSAAAAALKCTRFGGAFAAPSRAEVEALLAGKA